MSRRFNKQLIVGVLAVASAVVTLSARGEFVIRHVNAQHSPQGLRVSADVDLNLSVEAQSAVENGVPLVVMTEFAVLQLGVLWDTTLFKHKLRSRLRYHALSDRYIVERIGGSGIESFRSVDSALRRLGKIQNVGLGNIGELPKDSLLAVRSRLDINALPAPLRPMALFSADWRLSSDWTQWKIDR